MSMSYVDEVGSRNFQLVGFMERVIKFPIKAFFINGIFKIKNNKHCIWVLARVSLLSVIRSTAEHDYSSIRYGKLVLYCQISSAGRHEMRGLYYA